MAQPKRSPSNKQPIKVFHDKEISLGQSQQNMNSVPSGPKEKSKGRFLFNGLTIDVEEANKSGMMAGPSPPAIKRGTSPSMVKPKDMHVASRSSLSDSQRTPSGPTKNAIVQTIPGPPVTIQIGHSGNRSTPNIPLLLSSLPSHGTSIAQVFGASSVVQGQTPLGSTPVPTPGGLAGSNPAIELIKQFYQEQVDRLEQKNEELLRENERLKIELEIARRCAEEGNAVKSQFAELVRKHELLLSVGEPLFVEARPCRDIRREKEWDKLERDNSKCNSQISQDVHKDSCRERKNDDSGLIDEYMYNNRKIPSENISSDTREIQQDKDSSHLRDFITKLKQASEGLNKATKGNTHKKTNSLSSMQNKRRDLTGYYVVSNKTKGSKESAFNTAKQPKGYTIEEQLHFPLPTSKLDQRCSSGVALNKSSIGEYEQNIDKASKRSSLMSAGLPEAVLQATPNQATQEVPLELADFRKTHKIIERKSGPLQGLLKQGRSVQDYGQTKLRDERKSGTAAQKIKASVRQTKNWTRMGMSIQTSFD